MVNYVKFIRGSQEAWAKLARKDNDTLYFIYTSPDAADGVLYLGDKLISGGIVEFEEINGIDLDNLRDGDLLTYNSQTNKWIVKPPVQAIPVMTGATTQAAGTSGLVPVPTAGTNNLFLKGDGSWADPVPEILKKQISDLVGLDQEKSARQIAAEESAKVSAALTPTVNALSTAVSTLQEQTTHFVSDSVFLAGVGNLTKLFNYHKTNHTMVDAVNELDDRLTWQKII